MKETFTSRTLPLHNSVLTLVILCDMTIYFTVETHCSTRADTVGYIIHMDPAEGCGLRGVKIKAGWCSSLSLLIFTANLQGEREGACYHIVAMVPRVWKNSRVSMTLPRRLGWLDETSQASWCTFPFIFYFIYFFCIFQLFFLSFAHPEIFPPKLLSGLP